MWHLQVSRQVSFTSEIVIHALKKWIQKGPTSCPPAFNWAPAIPNGMFFQRSESPRNISRSSEIWDLCCMLNHFSAKLPKIDDWRARAEYMYRDAPANRRRAEGCVYVLETAFTVQRALCTFEGKGHPVQKSKI